MNNANITRPGGRVSIRKPASGGYASGNNFGGNWTSAETLATRWRDIYVDGELAGCAEKNDDGWWVSLDGLTPFSLAGGFRSPTRALRLIEAHVDGRGQ